MVNKKTIQDPNPDPCVNQVFPCLHSITDVCMNPPLKNEEELGAKSSHVLPPFRHVLWPEQKFQRHLARGNKVWHVERRKRKCHVGWRWGTDLGAAFGEWTPSRQLQDAWGREQRKGNFRKCHSTWRSESTWKYFKSHKYRLSSF